MKRIIGLLVLFGACPAAFAADEGWYGTWVQRSPPGMVMTVEPTAGGAKFTYRMPPSGGVQPAVLTFDTKLDGSYVPVFIDGKDSGETMLIKRIDDRRIMGNWKINGQDAGTSTSELSADGKAIKVVNENYVGGPNGSAGKTTEYWDKK